MNNNIDHKFKQFNKLPQTFLQIQNKYKKTNICIYLLFTLFKFKNFIQYFRQTLKFPVW